MKTPDHDPKNLHGTTGDILQRKYTDQATLAAIARQPMIDRGLEPHFPPAAKQEMATIFRPAVAAEGVRDMRDWLWGTKVERRVATGHSSYPSVDHVIRAAVEVYLWNAHPEAFFDRPAGSASSCT